MDDQLKLLASLAKVCRDEGIREVHLDERQKIKMVTMAVTDNPVHRELQEQARKAEEEQRKAAANKKGPRSVPNRPAEDRDLHGAMPFGVPYFEGSDS